MPPLVISQVIEQSKKPWRSPSVTIFSMWRSASLNWLRCPVAGAGVVASRIVQQRFHVFDGRGKSQRRDRRALAIERQHIIAAGRTIAEDEDLAPAFGAQIEEVIARAAQEAGEIEVAGFERALLASSVVIRLSSLHFTFSSKKGSSAVGNDALVRDRAMEQPKLLQPNAHRDRRHKELLGKRAGYPVEHIVIGFRTIEIADPAFDAR